MKIKPQQFAELLISTLSKECHSEQSEESQHRVSGGIDLKKIAASFWYLLQKNKQYRDLPKILELLDKEYAKSQGKVIAKVYSEEKLTKEQEKEIAGKLKPKLHDSSFIIHNSIKTTGGGVIVKIEDKIIDLSTIGKSNRLKRQLT